MLAKSFALILLCLALSPVHAPFQPGSGDKQQIASIEPLSGIRTDDASRVKTAARRFAEHDSAEIALPALISIVSTEFAAVTSGTRNSASTGDYDPSAAVLLL